MLWLEEEWTVGEKEVGGKAFHLNRLLQSSFPVPKGFVVLESVIEPYDLSSFLSGLSSATVAVRSSAVGEDGSDISFAGIHDTFLHVKNNVDDVLDAIRRCRESTNSPQAKIYKEMNISSYYENCELLNDSNMPVIIQEMISASAAGVCFTHHPVTRQQEIILIEAISGLGEALVSGYENPDQYTFQRKENSVTFLSKKVPGEKEDEKPVLSESIAIHIATLALEVEKESDNIPQDIEFACDGETIWLLQSRPITTLHSKQEDLLSDRNTKEVFPHPMTLMSWSAFQEVIEKGLQFRYKERGVDYRACIGPGIRSFYEIRRGYLYQNLSVTDILTRAEFGVGYEDALMKTFNEIPMEWFEACCITESVPLFSRAYGILGLVNYLRKSESKVDFIHATLKHYRKTFKEFEPWHTYKEASLHDLYTSFQEVQVDFGSFAAVYIENQISLELFTSIVKGIIESCCANTDISMFNELLVGLGNIITHQMNVDLVSLFRCATVDADAKEFIFGDQLKSSWREGMKDTETKERLIQFLHKFGHRAICELEVSSPRWGNDATYLFDLIKHALNSGIKEQNEEAILMAKREKMERKIIEDCSLLIRPLLQWAIPKLQEFIRFRENLKDIVIRFIAKQQQLLLSISFLWTTLGHVDFKMNDIFHLSTTQFIAFSEGNIDASQLVALMERNKELYEQYSGQHPPPAFMGRKKKTLLATNKVEHVDGGDKWKGNAGAPGIINGEAVVLLSLEDISSIPNTHDDTSRLILVTKVTDPAWTPLFLQFDGVVVETGGVLSHSAIVAREFGIPCVFGIHNATQLIASGDKITVNGDEGSITILKPAE